MSNSPNSLRDTPPRLDDLQLPGRVQGKLSARAADLRLIGKAPKGFLDTTHFDTVRFPPPDWALEAFAKSASDAAGRHLRAGGGGVRPVPVHLGADAASP